MSVSSRSLASLTRSRAECSAEGSIRMSSGASVAYEKPRSGRSSCMLETPRSSRIASAPAPLPASWPSTVAKSPRRKRVWRLACRFWKLSKYGRALGSRSIAISLPRPRSSSASSDAWPPAPKVASTTVSPGCTASAARTSSARTGTWSGALGCKTFGNIWSTPFEGGELGAPGRPIPDLEMVVDARDDDLPLELRVPDERGRDRDAALLVQLLVARAREREAPHRARLAAERVERVEPALDALGEVARRVGLDAGLEAAREDDSFRERRTELGREGDAVLVIDRVLVLAEKHSGRPLDHHCP